MEEVIRKYIAAIKSTDFIRYEKRFSNAIVAALTKGFQKGHREDRIVKVIESIINKIHDLRGSADDAHITTNAAFVHGNKSHVEFDCYGGKTTKELGDMIFIISVIFKKRKYLEKMTICSFKKEPPRDPKWQIDREQLYLLSRFPEFKGVRGIAPKGTEHALPNYSGCLGAYALLYRPGDFAFLSATRLERFLGPRKSLRRNDLHLVSYRDEYCHAFRFSIKQFPTFFMLRDMICMALKFSGQSDLWVCPDTHFDDCHFADNVFDFTHKYLTMGIGEPLYMKDALSNAQARRFLLQVMNALKRKTSDETVCATRCDTVADGFLRYGYATDALDDTKHVANTESDNDGGSIGIVHTTINLGE